MTKVTDLRTGLVHPVRDTRGRFISRKKASRMVLFLSRLWNCDMGSDRLDFLRSFDKRGR